jgi:hypothetical protein
MMQSLVLVCHWLSQLHPGTVCNWEKASETESASLLLVTRPNSNPRDVKVTGVLLITADIPPKALIPQNQIA